MIAFLLHAKYINRRFLRITIPKHLFVIFPAGRKNAVFYIKGVICIYLHLWSFVYVSNQYIVILQSCRIFDNVINPLWCMHMKYLHSPQTTPKTNINNLHVITHIIFDNPKRRLHTNNCYHRGVFDLAIWYTISIIFQIVVTTTLKW